MIIDYLINVFTWYNVFQRECDPASAKTLYEEKPSPAGKTFCFFISINIDIWFICSNNYYNLLVID